MKQTNQKSTLISDTIVLVVLSIGFFILAGEYDFLENLVEFTRENEEYELDELIPTAAFLSIGCLVFAVRRWHESFIMGKELDQQNRDLEKALKEIRSLEGILPICSCCQKIRNDEGYWEQVDAYIETRSEAQFSHSMCPDCIQEFYKDQPWLLESADD